MVRPREWRPLLALAGRNAVRTSGYDAAPPFLEPHRQEVVNKISLLVALLLVAACGPSDSSPDAPGSTANVDSLAAPADRAGNAPESAALPDSGSDSATATDSPAPAAGGQPAPSSSPAGLPAGPIVDLPPAVPSSEANVILARAERAFADVRSMEADFTQAVYVPLLDSTQNSRGRLFHRSPDRFLMRFSDPAGDVIVADGRYIWMFYPSTDDGQVMRAPLAAGGQQVDLYREFLEDATSRYAASLDGAESAGGRPAKALTLIPRQPSGYQRVRIWVDDQDSLVRRFEISEENGSVRRLELSGLRINVDLADALFHFTPPAGVQVHDF